MGDAQAAEPLIEIADQRLAEISMKLHTPDGRYWRLRVRRADTVSHHAPQAVLYRSTYGLDAENEQGVTALTIDVVYVTLCRAAPGLDQDDVQGFGVHVVQRHAHDNLRQLLHQHTLLMGLPALVMEPYQPTVPARR